MKPRSSGRAFKHRVISPSLYSHNNVNISIKYICFLFLAKWMITNFMLKADLVSYSLESHKSAPGWSRHASLRDFSDSQEMPVCMDGIAFLHHLKQQGQKEISHSCFCSFCDHILPLASLWSSNRDLYDSSGLSQIIEKLHLILRPLISSCPQSSLLWRVTFTMRFRPSHCQWYINAYNFPITY